MDAAHRLVELCHPTATPPVPPARPAPGCGWRRGSQLLWRDLLRAEYDGPGGPDAAAEAAAEMADVLAGRGAALEAETDALVEELLPARVATGRAESAESGASRAPARRRAVGSAGSSRTTVSATQAGLYWPSISIV